MPTTVAIVSLGTTPGLRVADAALAGQIEACGVACRIVRVRIGAAGRLRRQITVTDIVESLAAGKAGRGAAEADAVILSTTTCGYWLRPVAPYAVRFDTPAAVNRPGASGMLQRALERRSFAAAPLLLPYGGKAAAAARHVLRGQKAPPIVPLPVPIDGAPGSGPRDVDAVAYVGYPEKRALDALAAAWSDAARPGATLTIAGLEREAGEAWLAARGLAPPAGVTWAGLLPREEWLALLRRARVFVNFSRREDFGQAPLEALAAGAALVTAPSLGAYEALDIARDLGSPLVAADRSPAALAEVLAAGLALDEQARACYASAAADRLAPYRPAAVLRTVEEEVLPRLGLR